MAHTQHRVMLTLVAMGCIRHMRRGRRARGLHNVIAGQRTDRQPVVGRFRSGNIDPLTSRIRARRVQQTIALWHNERQTNDICL